MNKAMVVILFVGLILISGCAIANKLAPSKLDEAGEPIPGTHDVVQPIHDTAKTIPYAEPAIGVLLLVWNGIEKYRAYKLGKGLKSTIQAIEQAGNDPDMKDAIAKLKEDLSHAHDVAGVQPEVKNILAKL